MYRFIDEEKLLDLVRRAETRPEGSLVSERVRKWIARQPTGPDLIGAKAVSEILGILPPNVSKLKERGVLPPPIHVDGSVDAWVREDIEAIGARLTADRERRKAARMAREEQQV